MGIDCSNCRCTNKDDEKILIFDNIDKIGISNNSKARKERIVGIEKTKSKKLNIKEILETNEGLSVILVKLQSLIRRYRDRKTYKAILKKIHGGGQSYFCQEELFETVNKRKLKELFNSERSYTYKNGGIYSGKWLGGFRHGRGLMKWADGTYYEGEWNLGYAEGTGLLVYQNGDFMKGQFMYNKLNGFGECYNNELGYQYKGFWENDLQFGQGGELWPDGSEYFGLYELGKKDGFGKYTWTDGSYYIGEWRDNKILGLGVYYWSDGRKFIGEWKNSKMNGYGIFLWKDGRFYKGEYKDDKKHNFGMYFGNEGKSYEGFWEEGSQKNLGKYTKKDGSFKLGYWDENKLISPITNEDEIAQKMLEIDKYVDDSLSRVSDVVDSLKILFANYLPNLEFDSILEF